jgi:hypothetical protein
VQHGLDRGKSCNTHGLDSPFRCHVFVVVQVLDEAFGEFVERVVGQVHVHLIHILASRHGVGLSAEAR